MGHKVAFVRECFKPAAIAPPAYTAHEVWTWCIHKGATGPEGSVYDICAICEADGLTYEELDENLRAAALEDR
jgi:hypothetical protein